MTTFLSALHPALRSLFARPSYFIVSVIVLGVSIAAQLAIFAVVAALLLTPPSARQPDELAFVQSSLPRGIVSYPDFRDLQERATSLTGIFAYSIYRRQSLTTGDDLMDVPCGVVSGTYFPTLGAPPAAGRLLEPADDVVNAAPVAVISSALSRLRSLGVGATIKINTFPFTVVGVLPADYRGIERTTAVDVWIPTAQIAAVGPRYMLTNRGVQWLTVGGRLKPGVSLATANAEIAAIGRMLQAESPQTNYGMTLQARSFASFRYALDGSARLMVLLGGLVWLLFTLAFTNFFALTLLRLLDRRRELAVRVAIGATRAHLARALLVELGCVALTSFAVGGGLAWGLLQAMQRDPHLHTLMGNAGIQIDRPTLAAVGLLVLGSSLVVWLLALRTADRVDVLSAIKEGSSAPRRQTAFAALFAVQFALALFLGATAVSFISALRTIASQAYPFRTENLLLFDVNFRNLGLTDTRVAETEKILARLRAVPGVVAAGGGASAPLDRVRWTNLIVDGRDPAREPDKGLTNWSMVTGDYLAASGIRLLQGRAIETQDILNNTKVVMINVAAVKRYWPDRNPLGQTLKPYETSVPLTIVGVVDDVPTDTSAKILPEIYQPWGQSSPTSLVFHIAVQDDSPAMRQAIVAGLRDVWPHKTPPVLRSIRDQIGTAAADLTTAMRVVFWLAGFATLVTACGLYFFSAYTAAQTLKDSAIRQALGAERQHLIAAHLARYRVGMAAGLVLGVGLLFGARPLFAHLDITSSPMTVGCVVLAAGLLSAIALVGLVVPLHNILRLDLARILGRDP